MPINTADLLVRPIFDDQLWLVALKSDLFLNEGPNTLTLGLIDRTPIFEEGHCLRDHTLIVCGAATPALHGGVEAISLLTLVEMIASGLGIGLVSATRSRTYPQETAPFGTFWSTPSCR